MHIPARIQLKLVEMVEIEPESDEVTYDDDAVGRDPVAPPELPRDAPVVDVIEPVEPGRPVHRGEDRKVAARDGT